MQFKRLHDYSNSDNSNSNNSNYLNYKNTKNTEIKLEIIVKNSKIAYYENVLKNSYKSTSKIQKVINNITSRQKKDNNFHTDQM